ncbi:nitroreductase family protein [Iamia sp.]|uniref:nitroreductase family protein n=1 Tax=Iamia sp. TaxID=2722710 RepID=UPI002CA39087|nr:nitroreductase family protein [Iamia sp.]HXH56426.1 nitroreductase family protein [Iamia sp.]
MELSDALRRRRMVRSFGPDRVEPALLDSLLDAARRAPSAGRTEATRFLVLDTPEAVAGYWDLTLAPARRVSFSWPGLLVAPVLVVVLVDPAAYVARYAEADKVATGLGAGLDAWSVPYWWVDAGAVVQNLLLGAVDAGLGACLFGLFAAEDAVLAAHGVPGGWRAVGTVALGHRAPDRAGRSAGRPRPPLGEVVHRGRWDQPPNG